MPRKRKSALVITDHIPGESYIRDHEAVAKVRQENEDQAAKTRLYRQDELSDPERSSGPRMPYAELIQRLRRVNSAFLFKDGVPGNIAMYRPKTREELEDADAWDPSAYEWHNRHVYVNGFPKKPLPEFSSVVEDDRGRPNGDLRSWRAVLISAVKSGAVSYNEVVKEFGEPLGQRGWSWFEQLLFWKKNPSKRFTKKGDSVCLMN